MEDDPYFAYHEFNEVRETVNHMSDLIDANQRSQQLFFQNSSHELRTPLMSIQGYAEGIREGLSPIRKKQLVLLLMRVIKWLIWLRIC